MRAWLIASLNGIGVCVVHYNVTVFVGQSVADRAFGSSDVFC
jgi:hypothetical protein